jgi:hypothetical protein
MCVLYGMHSYREDYVIILYQIKSNHDSIQFNSIQFNLTILTYVSSVWLGVVLFEI